MKVSSVGNLLIDRSEKVIDLDVDPSSIAALAKETAERGYKVGNLLSLGAKHVHRYDDPMFTRDPVLADINQNQMGDCWFLAALAAILHVGGPLAIGLMIFGYRSTCLVRLYDHIGRPLYLRLDKSVLEVPGQATFHSTGGLWTMMLEKAMTAFVKSKKGDVDSHRIFAPEKASYEELSGGMSSDAFSILLGVEADYEAIGQVPYHYDDLSDDFTKLRKILRGDDIDFHSVHQIFGKVPNAPGGYALYHVLWSQWVQQANLYFPWINALGTKTGLGGVYRYDDLEKYLRDEAKKPVNAQQWIHLGKNEVALDDVMTAILSWARERKILAEKRGTGHYNDAQLGLYERIRSHLARCSPLCLGTEKVVGTPAPTPGSSGEPVSKGLAGGHAYAILDTYHDQQTGVRYLKVFNPWGRIGRGYVFAPQKIHMIPNPTGAGEAMGHTAYTTDSAVFWMPLADVTKRGKRLYYCKETPKILQRTRKF